MIALVNANVLTVITTLTQAVSWNVKRLYRQATWTNQKKLVKPCTQNHNGPGINIALWLVVNANWKTCTVSNFWCVALVATHRWLIATKSVAATVNAFVLTVTCLVANCNACVLTAGLAITAIVDNATSFPAKTWLAVDTTAPSVALLTTLTILTNVFAKKKVTFLIGTPTSCILVDVLKNNAWMLHAQLDNSASMVHADAPKDCFWSTTLVKPLLVVELFPTLTALAQSVRTVKFACSTLKALHLVLAHLALVDQIATLKFATTLPTFAKTLTLTVCTDQLFHFANANQVTTRLTVFAPSVPLLTWTVQSCVTVKTECVSMVFASAELAGRLPTKLASTVLFVFLHRNATRYASIWELLLFKLSPLWKRSQINLSHCAACHEAVCIVNTNNSPLSNKPLLYW
jgi:hypothetical protein